MRDSTLASRKDVLYTLFLQLHLMESVQKGKNYINATVSFVKNIQKKQIYIAHLVSSKWFHNVEHHGKLEDNIHNSEPLNYVNI